MRPRPGSGLHRHDAGFLPLAATAGPSHGTGDRRRFSTALLRGLIRDEAVRAESPLGVDVGALPGELKPGR